MTVRTSGSSGTSTTTRSKRTSVVVSPLGRADSNHDDNDAVYPPTLGKGKAPLLQTSDTALIPVSTRMPKSVSDAVVLPLHQGHSQSTQGGHSRFPFHRKSSSMESAILGIYVCRLSQLRVEKSLSFFDRSVTRIEWHTHPNYSNILAVGSKGGDIVWVDHLKSNIHSAFSDTSTQSDSQQVPFIYGLGAGGKINAIKFHPSEPSLIYTASVDGTVKLQDFEGKNSSTFLDLDNKDKWFTALDITPHKRLFMVVNNDGWGTLLDLEGRKLHSELRLHKGKCQSLEFHPTNSNYLCSGGNDRVVHLWDLRMMTRSAEVMPISSFPHEGVIHSASFSPHNPHSLLTTASNNECRLYDINAVGSGQDMALIVPEFILFHPHRPFQHLTAIEAAWSPAVPSLFSIGRYPEANAPTDARSIDTYQFTPDAGADGAVRLVNRLVDDNVNGIQCLVRYNRAGDVLASCSGRTTYIWNFKMCAEEDEAIGVGRSHQVVKGKHSLRGKSKK